MVLGQFSPGPDMVLLTRTALKCGPGEGLRMAAGIACGLSVHATIAVAGLAVAFQQFPALRRGLEWVAAVYLLWLAQGMLRGCFLARKSGAEADRTEPPARRSPFVTGLLCNLFNPKVALFLAAVCAPFLSGERPVGWAILIWGTIVGLGLGLWSLWVLVLQWRPLRLWYERRSGVLDAFFGAVLVVLAIWLIVGS